jgi:hypothetical protein
LATQIWVPLEVLPTCHYERCGGEGRFVQCLFEGSGSSSQDRRLRWQTLRPPSLAFDNFTLFGNFLSMKSWAIDRYVDLSPSYGVSILQRHCDRIYENEMH